MASTNTFIKHRLGYMTGFTTNGQKYIFDEEDFERVKEHSWCSDGNGYLKVNINKKTVRLHRFVMEAKEGEQIDHKNLRRWDNRKKNLRFCNTIQNMHNSPRKKYKSEYRCKYKGVTKISKSTWRAKICFEGKVHYLVCFKKIRLAAQAYNEKAKELFGEFAFLNKFN